VLLVLLIINAAPNVVESG